MLPDNTAIAYLSLLVERMRDAELLLDTEGETLLKETDAARRLLETGDTETARRHVERVALLMEALVSNGTQEGAHAQAIIETARGIAAETGVNRIRRTPPL